MEYYNYPVFTPFILSLSTHFFKSKKNKDLSEYQELTKNTNIPLISDLQHNNFQTNNSAFFKFIIWMFSFLCIYNHFPDSNIKNYLFISILAHFFIFHGDFKTEKKLIFNFSVHMIFSLFLLGFMLYFKFKFHRIFDIQYVTLFLNIYIMYKDKSNNHNLSNNFVYLQWLNYIIEFFPYQLLNTVQSV
jgi:hypothetical protein